MNRAVTRHSLVIALAIAVVALGAACSKSNSLSPVRPSASTSASGATIAGLVNGQGASALTVSVDGSSARSSVNSAGRFEIDNAPAGNIVLRFSGSGVNASLSLGQVEDGSHVEVHVSVSGNSASIDESQEVKPDDEAEISGRVSSIDPSSRTMLVGSTQVQVASGAAITSRGNSMSFADLKANQFVEVHGTMQGSTVNADRVQIDDDVEPAPGPEPQPEPEPADAEFTGSISAMSGGCPGLSMTIAGRSVATDGSTQFDKTSCGALSIGNMVQVKGKTQGNGSILASRIQFEDK